MITLYNAISVDGFIAGDHDETPWSDEEWVAFREFVKTCDVCLLGRRTYEIMRDGGEFVEGPEYIVVTSDHTVDTGRYKKLAIRSADDLPKVEKIGLIGGGELNGSLVELGVIDEVILDVEPVLLGSGKRLFGSHRAQSRLDLLSSRKIGAGTIQNHYKMIYSKTFRTHNSL